VLHCPHCGGSFVPNSGMYQGIASRLQKFYATWTKSFDELRARRKAELDRFAAVQERELQELQADVERVSVGAELAGAPQRNRGIFG
jgi:hypothetical protein